jgi:aspartate oxidase
MIHLAEVIVEGALARESRGSHFRTDYPVEMTTIGFGIPWLIKQAMARGLNTKVAITNYPPKERTY